MIIIEVKDIEVNFFQLFFFHYFIKKTYQINMII